MIVVTAEPAAAERRAPPARASSTTRWRPASRPPPCAGSHAALERGAERVLLVPGDCPALDPGEVSALLAHTGRRRDRARPPRAGHQRAAADAAGRDGAGVRRGLVRAPRALARTRRARPCRSPTLRSLGLDVDTPDDLAALRRALAARAGGAARTRALLEERAAACSSCVALPGPAGDPARGRPRGAAGAARRAASCAPATCSRSPTRWSPRPRGGSCGSPTSRPARGRSRWRAEHGKDPRHVEVVLSETARGRARGRGPADLPHPARVRVRQRGRRRLQRRRAGLAGAAAAGPGRARPARCAPRCPAAPRWSSPTPSAARGATGQCEIAIGVAGCAPLEDWRGLPDAAGASCTPR